MFLDAYLGNLHSCESQITLFIMSSSKNTDGFFVYGSECARVISTCARLVFGARACGKVCAIWNDDFKFDFVG